MLIECNGMYIITLSTFFVRPMCIDNNCIYAHYYFVDVFCSFLLIFARFASFLVHFDRFCIDFTPFSMFFDDFEPFWMHFGPILHRGSFVCAVSEAV